MKRNALSFLTSLAVLLTFLGGCAANNTAETSPSPSGQTVTDGTGRQLSIPENPEDTSIATVYAVSVPFIVALDLSDKVVAVNVKSNFWTQADENLAKAGSVGRGAVDLEALAELSPTVLIHRSNDEQTVQAVSGKLGIDVLCLTVESLDDIKNTLQMMGAYFGREERAKEVMAWMDAKFKIVDDIVATIPENERKTAVVLGSEPGRVAGGDMLQSWMIEKAGGKSVAKDVTSNRNWANVGVETVFGWNPAYIFTTSSTPLDYTIDSLMADNVWGDVQAVKDKHVYQLPAKIDTWDMPGISCPLGAMYMLHKMHPEYFTAEQLQNEIDEYYTFMFGKTFSADYLGYDLEN